MIFMQGVKKAYGTGDARVEALRGVDLSVGQGEMLAVMGKSGSGKSTLLNILGGIAGMDEGTYLFRGESLSDKDAKQLGKFRRDSVGFIVQYFALIDELTVYQNVAMPLKYQKVKRRRIREKVEKALEDLEILDKAKAYPNELSGGQQQRVSIARALVKNAELILADEPTGALDEETGDRVLSLLEQLHQMGMTIIIVTHDERVAKRCNRIVYMRDGRMEEN